MDAKPVAALLFALAVLAAPFAAAHEAHDHSRVMGTVSGSEGWRIVVKTVEGNPVTIRLDSNTAFLDADGNRVKSRPDIGSRIVVKARREGEELVADEVRFSAPSGAVAPEAGGEE